MKDNRQDDKYYALIQSLYREKERIHSSLRELLSEDMRDSLAELSLADNHPADIGTELYQRERDIAQRDKLKSREEAIDAALALWEKGLYGTCRHCGRPISPERLKAIPYTTVCAECSRQAEEEEHHSYGVNPVEEEIVSSTFHGHTGGDAGTEYDQEDAWQDVARYGTSDSLQDLGTNRDIADPARLYEDGEEGVGGVEKVELIPTEQDGQDKSGFPYSADHRRR